jgi:hypothetical protein
MNERPDAYWDELGVAWSAIRPDENVIARRLEARLRHQSRLITLGFVVAVPLSVAGLVLGVFTIWTGATAGVWHFVARGTTIAVVSLLVAGAAATLLPVRASDMARSLSDMLELAAARARRALLVVRLGFWACGITAVLGMAGAVIRTRFTGPPLLSPAIDVLILAVFAAGLYLYGRHTRTKLARLRVLAHTLAPHGDEQ